MLTYVEISHESVDSQLQEQTFVTWSNVSSIPAMLVHSLYILDKSNKTVGSVVQTKTYGYDHADAPSGHLNSKCITFLLTAIVAWRNPGYKQANWKSN